jgi:hypothetical protein
MTHKERLMLAAGWLRVAHSNSFSNAHDKDVMRTLFRLCQEKPHDAWQIITTIAESDPSTSTATLLAQGLIKEIMMYHGIRFLRFFEQHAVRNQALQYAIEYVRRSQVGDVSRTIAAASNHPVAQFT